MRWELTDDDDVLWGLCAEVGGLFADEEEPLRLIGCEPRGLLVSTLRPGAKGGMYLSPLGRSGWFFQLKIAEVRPSSLGDGLVDITLEDDLLDEIPRVHRIPRAAKGIWDMWFAGGPATTNLWAPLDSTIRYEWARAAWHMRQPRDDREAGGTYHLDGRHITGETGLYCALGEAINGPGGYFGRDWNGVKDCLFGGFGARTPFTLIWHDSAVAAHRLPLEPGHNPEEFGDWLDLLRRFKITVVLD